MQETRKVERPAVAARSTGRIEQDPRVSSTTAEDTQVALRSLAGRIRQDAGDDAVTYLLRSNTGHDGE